MSTVSRRSPKLTVSTIGAAPAGASLRRGATGPANSDETPTRWHASRIVRRSNFILMVAIFGLFVHYAYQINQSTALELQTQTLKRSLSSSTEETKRFRLKVATEQNRILSELRELATGEFVPAQTPVAVITPTGTALASNYGQAR